MKDFCFSEDVVDKPFPVLPTAVTDSPRYSTGNKYKKTLEGGQKSSLKATSGPREGLSGEFPGSPFSSCIPEAGLKKPETRQANGHR